MRIREFLQTYPETGLSIEEIGDFFKAELRLDAQVTAQVVTLLKALDKPLTRKALQERLGLKHREHFRRNYLQPALLVSLRCQIRKNPVQRIRNTTLPNMGSLLF